MILKRKNIYVLNITSASLEYTMLIDKLVQSQDYIDLFAAISCSKIMYLYDIYWGYLFKPDNSEFIWSVYVSSCI